MINKTEIKKQKSILKNKIMLRQKKIFASYAAILLLKEPYEMTYWKAKLNTPWHRIKVAFNQWWMPAQTIPVLS